MFSQGVESELDEDEGGDEEMRDRRYSGAPVGMDPRNYMVRTELASLLMC